MDKFFVLINHIQDNLKIKYGLMADNFRFNIKLVLGLETTPKASLRVKYWYSIKCVTKTKFHLIIMKFVVNLKNRFYRVLGVTSKRLLPKIKF